jgi:TonB family protein
VFLHELTLAAVIKLITRSILIASCIATPSISFGGAQPTQLAGKKMAGLEIPPGPTRDYDVPPKFIRGDAPTYPISRALSRVTGDATIEYTIDEHGVPGDFKILKTSYKYFAYHAIIAMRNWRFEPAQKKGRPVAVHAQMTFNFGGWKFDSKPNPGGLP